MDKTNNQNSQNNQSQNKVTKQPTKSETSENTPITKEQLERNQSRIRSIQQRISSGGSRTEDIDTIKLDTYHYLMMTYGWIPWEEFSLLPQEIVNELVERINKDNEKNKSGLPSGRRGLR